MDKLEKYSVTTTWIKTSEVKNGCFVGSDAIAFSLGSHILFTNLTSGQEVYYRADLANGDGVTCMAGHKVFPIFAFAESCWNARIFIISYPEFNRISILECKEECIYIGLSFSETEHLIALTGMPSYKIQVWYWRTQDLLISESTALESDKQRITCSSSLPLTVAQLAYTKGQLNVWEIHGTQKFCKLIKRKIRLNFTKIDGPFSDVYSIEGNIQIVNRHGDIFYVIPSSGSVNLICKWNGEKGNYNSTIAYIRNGILVSGPDGMLKYFKRQKYVWNEISQTSAPEPFVMLKSYHDNETVIGTTINGGLYRIILMSDGERLSIIKIKDFEKTFVSFNMLYPTGDHLIVADVANEIHVMSIETSRLVAKLSITNHTVIQSHPIYPLIAVGTVDGSLYFMSLIDPEQPAMLAEFSLSRQFIVGMRFSDAGHFLVAIDEDSNIFIISGEPGGQMEVFHHLKEEMEFADFFIIENDEKLEIIMLQKSTDHPKRGSNLLQFIVPFDKPLDTERNEWTLPSSYICIVPIIGSSKSFYGIRYGVRYIEILDFENGSIVLADIIETPHQLKHIEGYNDGSHLVTWSLDGIVAVYDVKNNNELISAFVAHNRHNLGTKLARCDPKCELIVTLGQSGNLICSNLNVKKSTETDEILEEKLKNIQEKIAEIFSRPTTGGFPGSSKKYQGKKFTDLKSEQTFEMEAKDSEATRNMIFTKLNNLRVEVKKLLDQNEANPVEEQLEIQDFNLDIITTKQKEQEAKQERDQEEKRMMDYIDAQTMMNNWIIEKCWNPIEVKGAKLRGMFVNLFVDNFSLLPEPKNDQLEKIKMMRAIENSVAREDVFLPWRPISTIELERILTKEPGMFELSSNDLTQFRRITSTLMGADTHRFIQISPIHYQQMDVVSFHQMHAEKHLVESELTVLKKNFNEKFDAMHRSKEFQIHSIRFKNDRLRHIQSELKILDELNGETIDSLPQILDPDFQPDETPDAVVNVIESEVCVAPYVSPSYLKMLEEQETAREKRRRELEADDFRDRALDMMMDGVLEHRWEDELKKNPKKPECLLNQKSRDDWTESEIRDVEDYHQQLNRLCQEREKYRRMLNEEQKLLQNMLDEEIKKFNYGLAELAMEKLKIDMVIAQEEMKLLMTAQYNFRRISHQREEIEIRLKMERVKGIIDELVHLQNELQDWIRDIKTNYENLQAKDKTLEKQFKANFNEAAPSAPVDQAFKYFKRRPKLQMRAQITSPILLEVAKRVASKKLAQQIKLLPSECIEYLNGVDLLDQVASSTTGTGIDQNSWQILCKMRRIKIESEFKIKSLGLQLADAEATLTAYMKEINNKRNHLQSVERSLMELKENRENDLINRHVQIVMKRGLIEIPLTGSFTDFNDSILIHRSDVDDINKIIIKAGLKKLRALTNAAMFRRKITLKEWEHRVLKLKVRDLKEFVKTIEKCKITKEVQQWLKRKERGWSENLGESALNREIENCINAQEKFLNEILKEVSLLDSRIVSKKKEIQMLDKQIQLLNIDVSEQNFTRDVEFEREEIRGAKERMAMILERAKIVRHIQHQHSHLLQLSTLLELQRLKTYPTLTATHGGRYQQNYRK